MTPLVYLQLAGAQVNYYTTVSFTHTKYICTDNATAAVSSINYSKASMIENREAGLVVANDKEGEIIGFLQAVFNYDWHMSIPFPIGNYSDIDYHYVNDKRMLPVSDAPVPHSITCDYKSPAPTPISANMDVSVIASPDFAWDAVMHPLRHAKSSLWLSIYQITDNSFCDLLIDLASQIDLRVFVSNEIYAQHDAAEAAKCYTKLYQNNIIVKKSREHCLHYSHQKFWIIDDESVTMSTGNWSPSDYPQAPYTVCALLFNVCNSSHLSPVPIIARWIVITPFKSQMMMWLLVSRPFSIWIIPRVMILNPVNNAYCIFLQGKKSSKISV